MGILELSVQFAETVVQIGLDFCETPRETFIFSFRIRNMLKQRLHCYFKALNRAGANLNKSIREAVFQPHLYQASHHDMNHIIHDNIADADMLKEAQRNPDAYGDLLVRIGGYSDFFVRIDKDLQDEIIRRSLM